MNCDLNSSAPDWLIDYPATSAIFDELGLDVTCAGKSLDFLCRQQGLDPHAALARLQQAIVEWPTDAGPSGDHRKGREY